MTRPLYKNRNTRSDGRVGQSGGAYPRVALRAESGDALTSACLPGFSLALGELFG